MTDHQEKIVLMQVWISKSSISLIPSNIKFCFHTNTSYSKSNNKFKRCIGLISDLIKLNFKWTPERRCFEMFFKIYSEKGILNWIDLLFSHELRRIYEVPRMNFGFDKIEFLIDFRIDTVWNVFTRVLRIISDWSGLRHSRFDQIGSGLNL